METGSCCTGLTDNGLFPPSLSLCRALYVTLSLSPPHCSIHLWLPKSSSYSFSHIASSCFARVFFCLPNFHSFFPNTIPLALPISEDPSHLSRWLAFHSSWRFYLSLSRFIHVSLVTMDLIAFSLSFHHFPMSSSVPPSLHPFLSIWTYSFCVRLLFFCVNFSSFHLLFKLSPSPLRRSLRHSVKIVVLHMHDGCFA